MSAASDKNLELLAAIERAGIVGCGGAGFPTHAKLKGSIRHLILNGAECEPLLRTDRYLMLHHAGEIVRAAAAVKEAVGAEECTIGLKAGYTEEIAALEEAIEAQNAPVRLHRMQSFYPAGDEQVLVAEITGRVIPAAGIPLDVGCAVSNVGTMYNIALAMQGENFIKKFLTVSGAVAKPTVVCVPVGTSFRDCLELAGGVPSGEWMAISGGPMMGKRMTKEEALAAYVTKTTSGILIIPADNPLALREKASLRHMYARARSACIQCQRCTDLCPRHLLGHPLEPHRIMRQLATMAIDGVPADNRVLETASLCCECGICELFACPMDLAPRKLNAMLKQELAKEKKRWPKGEGQKEPSPWREGRKAPTKRVAARADVLEYYDRCGTASLAVGEPAKVRLALRQQIGAPSRPVVSVGERVTAGQLIAAIPEGALSANLHASISGVVTAIDDAICIEKEK